MRRSHPYVLAWLLASATQSLLIAIAVAFPDRVTHLLARGRIGHIVDRVPHSELVFPLLPVVAILLFIDLLSPSLHTPERWPDADKRWHTGIQRGLRSLLRWWTVLLYLLVWLAFLYVAGVREMDSRYESLVNLLVLFCLIELLTLRGFSDLLPAGARRLKETKPTRDSA